MNQHRIIDHVTSPAHEPETTNIIPIHDEKMSAASLGSAKSVATSTMSVIGNSVSRWTGDGVDLMRTHKPLEQVAMRYLAVEGVDTKVQKSSSARLAAAPRPAIFDSDAVQPDRSVPAPEEGFASTSGTRRVGGMT